MQPAMRVLRFSKVCLSAWFMKQWLGLTFTGAIYVCSVKGCEASFCMRLEPIEDMIKHSPAVTSSKLPGPLNVSQIYRANSDYTFVSSLFSLIGNSFPENMLQSYSQHVHHSTQTTSTSDVLACVCGQKVHTTIIGEKSAPLLNFWHMFSSSRDKALGPRVCRSPLLNLVRVYWTGADFVKANSYGKLGIIPFFRHDRNESTPCSADSAATPSQGLITDAWAMIKQPCIQ